MEASTFIGHFETSWTSFGQSFTSDDSLDKSGISKQNVSFSALVDRMPIPVTISSLLANINDSSDHYVVAFYSFSTVQIIGTVLSMEESNGASIYTLQDPEFPAKQIIVQKYSSNENTTNDDDMIVEGIRIRCIGKIKEFEGNLILMAYFVDEISDDKDYTIFRLEARASRLFFEKNVIDKIRRRETDNLTGMLAPPKRVDEKIKIEPMIKPTLTKPPLSNNEQIQRKILDYFVKFPSHQNNNDGVSFETLRRYAGSGTTVKNFMDNVNALMDNGKLYNTFDDYFSILP
ncbi:unnamed protein product [Caenorhabditis bovis]|uniref:Replication protein A C-terminal domain-containing protein n=1 Tax=Caenorhabditis bovis TaxID=2654633 RepID=A0A8S1EUB2_9PELO|nr:unnamed protein product [Caenorhabditis bovis]